MCREGLLPGLFIWTRLLPFLLIWNCGVRASFPFPVGLHAFRALHTVAFRNTSVDDIMGALAFLGDVETYLYDSHIWKITFLQPWARNVFSPQEWKMLEKIFKAYFIGFKRTINYFAVALNVSYPFVIQSLIVCEIGPDETKRGFYNAAANGDTFIVFSAENASWVAQKEDKLSLYIQDHLNKDKGTILTLRSLLLNQCITALETLLQTGKAALDRQEEPVAVVFAEESPATNDSLLLVCRVTSFYPRQINISWLEDEKALSSSGINSTTILPNYDQTYQIRSSLAIKSVGNAHNYACRVQHSSLGKKNLIIPWKRKQRSTATIVIIIVVILIIAVLAVLYYLRKKRRQYEDIHNTAPTN